MTERLGWDEMIRYKGKGKNMQVGVGILDPMLFHFQRASGERSAFYRISANVFSFQYSHVSLVG